MDRKEYDRVKYLKNRDKILARVKEYNRRNPESAKLRHTSWRARNPEKIREMTHARRARKNNSGGRFLVAEWRALKEAFGFVCLRCGVAESKSKLVMDHVVPLAAGGTNDISNIQPLCAKCNSWKYTKTIDYRKLKPEEHKKAERKLISFKGLKKSPMSEETKKKLSAALTGRKIDKNGLQNSVMLPRNRGN